MLSPHRITALDTETANDLAFSAKLRVSSGQLHVNALQMNMHDYYCKGGLYLLL